LWKSSNSVVLLCRFCYIVCNSTILIILTYGSSTHFGAAMIEYLVDVNRAGWVVSRSLDAIRQRKGIFRLQELIPEEILPEGIIEGSADHARYLFYGSILDGLRGSMKVWKAARRLAELGLEDILEMPKEELEQRLKVHLDLGIGNPADTMRRSAKMLREKYQNDPRQILDGITDFEEARKKVSEFNGLGRQKSSLLIENLCRFGYVNIRNLLPKIDRHANRISLGNGVVAILSDGIELSMHNLQKWLVRKHDVHISGIVQRLEGAYAQLGLCTRDAVDFDDAKYVIGSNVCVQNSYARCEELCPLDCSMLVMMKRHASYAIVPSERRSMQFELLK